MLNQLIDFSRTNGRSQSWDMDGQGNFETVTTDGTPENRTHNAQNQLTQVGSSTLTFDANGNMTTDELWRRFRYDAWNRIVRATDSEDNPIIDFTYDALNRRIQEIRPSETRDLFYSTDWQLLEEQVEEVAVVHYVWSPVYVDAMILRDGADSGDPQPVLYAMQDANFNVTGIVSTAGSVQERYVYDPYGAVTYLTGNWGSRSASLYGWVYNHQGLRFVIDVGLYYVRYRDMSPTLQRWVQQDPVWATNLYAYVTNRPTTLLDPHGLFALEAFDLGNLLNRDGRPSYTFGLKVQFPEIRKVPPRGKVRITFEALVQGTRRNGTTYGPRTTTDQILQDILFGGVQVIPPPQRPFTQAIFNRAATNWTIWGSDPAEARTVWCHLTRKVTLRLAFLDAKGLPSPTAPAQTNSYTYVYINAGNFPRAMPIPLPLAVPPQALLLSSETLVSDNIVNLPSIKVFSPF